MTVKIPSHADCSGKVWPDVINFFVRLSNSNTVYRAMWTWKEHGDDEMLSKCTCGKLKQGEKLREILCKCFVNSKLAEDKTVSQQASSDPFARLDLYRSEPFSTFSSCVRLWVLVKVWYFVSHCGVKVWGYVTYSRAQLRVFLTKYRNEIWVL